VRPAEPLVLASPERGGQATHIARAAAAAIDFWEAVTDSARIRGEEVRAVARANRDAVARFVQTFAS
jgi:hypothetical protein